MSFFRFLLATLRESRILWMILPAGFVAALVASARVAMILWLLILLGILAFAAWDHVRREREFARHAASDPRQPLRAPRRGGEPAARRSPESRSTPQATRLAELARPREPDPIWDVVLIVSGTLVLVPGVLAFFARPVLGAVVLAAGIALIAAGAAIGKRRHSTGGPGGAPARASSRTGRIAGLIHHPGIERARDDFRDGIARGDGHEPGGDSGSA